MYVAAQWRDGRVKVMDVMSQPSSLRPSRVAKCDPGIYMDAERRRWKTAAVTDYKSVISPSRERVPASALRMSNGCNRELEDLSPEQQRGPGQIL